MLRTRQKECMLIRLIEQNNSLVRKERFMHTDYDDLQYQGITEVKPLYNYISLDEYYEPELCALERNYERYRRNGDRDK